MGIVTAIRGRARWGGSVCARGAFLKTRQAIESESSPKDRRDSTCAHLFKRTDFGMCATLRRERSRPSRLLWEPRQAGRMWRTTVGCCPVDRVTIVVSRYRRRAFDVLRLLQTSGRFGEGRTAAAQAMPVASRWRCCNAPSVGGTRGMPCHAPVEYPRLAKTLGFWAFRELLPRWPPKVPHLWPPQNPPP